MSAHVLTLRWGRASARVPRRTVAVSLALSATALGLTMLALMVGERVFSPAEVVSALMGRAEPAAELFIVEWRLPRALAALLFGCCLGAAGAIFQTLTGNPLGSPDIIGFTTGAHTGGILVILFLSSSYAAVAAGAVVGGLLTGVIIYVLAYRSGVQGFRLIIVGIGITALLSGLDAYLLLVSGDDLALVAATWGVGSLNAVAWEHVAPALALAVTVLVIPGLIQRPLAQLPLGDDAASALGAAPERTRLLALLIGVLLVAVPTATAGPIAFVALASPQIGRRLAGAAGTPLLPAALTGGVLLAAADLMAQHLLPGLQVPVGVVTVSLGGGYLLWLIIRENGRRLS